MATPYSTRFLLGLSLSGSNAYTYTVPAGKTAVLRDLAVVSSAAGDNVSVAINGYYFLNLVAPSTLPAGGAQLLWSGRQVAEAGDVITLHTNGEMAYALSGYLLRAS
jgi:hypothetical protein